MTVFIFTSFRCPFTFPDSERDDLTPALCTYSIHIHTLGYMYTHCSVKLLTGAKQNFLYTNVITYTHINSLLLICFRILNFLVKSFSCNTLQFYIVIIQYNLIKSIMKKVCILLVSMTYVNSSWICWKLGTEGYRVCVLSQTHGVNVSRNGDVDP